jgi:hypothetical protein
VTDRPKWGKAGQRLDPESTRRRRSSRAWTQRVVEEHRVEDEQARQKWLMGLVVPAHITMALDGAGLYGPEVDWACGVQEPAVDNWEAGRLYPSWEQILRLAELTGRRPSYFMAPVHQVTSLYDTSMRFHLSFAERHPMLPLPVHRFNHQALINARKWGVRA